MRSEKTVNALDTARYTQRPSLLHSLFELRFPMEAALFWVHGIHHPWPSVAKHGNRKSVMLIPGFMAGDMSLAPLAGLCRWLGHKTFFTGIRSNSNCPRETVLHLERHLERIYDDEGRVVVIGQSLGGVYARELAARRPELIERVITLGSPIRLVEDSANALVLAMARLVAKLRNMDDGCLTQSCSCGMMLVEHHPGEVPTTVVYSKTDGVVHWDSCIDRSGAKTVENIEVMASHVGMGVNTEVFKVVAERLASAPRSIAPRPAGGVVRLMRRREMLPQLS
jgi:triacylglycerol lipase